MSLVRAIADIKRFSQGGFSALISFTNISGSETAEVNGLVSKHNLSINPETGLPVNSKNAHISVAESVLLEAGYTTRVNGEISLRNHKVVWTDASGTAFSYRIDEVFPSETTGLIVCTLGIYG